MIIMAHRGAAGLAPENTFASIDAGLNSGADIIHIDVRLTRDDVPVLLHDSTLMRTHNFTANIEALTYASLKQLTKHLCPPKLEMVMKRYFGKTLLNIELRSPSSGQIVAKLVQHYAGDDQALWDAVLISSFKTDELASVRRLSPQANVALLLDNNPFRFVVYHRSIQFTAVGFHRLHINPLALAIATKTGLFTYAYTVDRPQAIGHLETLGIEGVLTDFPDKLIAYRRKKTN